MAPTCVSPPLLHDNHSLSLAAMQMIQGPLLLEVRYIYYHNYVAVFVSVSQVHCIHVWVSYGRVSSPTQTLLHEVE